MLGDIILARGVCEAEAADKGVAVEDHAVHLLVHGTLHLLGYDHHDDESATDMEAREVRALHGWASPILMRARLMASGPNDGGSRLWRGSST